MAKDSIFVGPVNGSDFKNKGTSSTLAAQKNGTSIPGRTESRTKSPRAQDEVTKVLYGKLQKPTSK